MLPVMNLHSLSLRLPAVCVALSAGPLQCVHSKRQEWLFDNPGDSSESKAILEVQRAPLFAHNVRNTDVQALLSDGISKG